MTEQYIIRKGIFQHITLEGTSYEVGRMQAETLKATGETAAPHCDKITEDLCFSRGKIHEKFAWMLRAQLR